MKKSFLVSALIFLFISGYGQTAEDYNKQGKTKIDQGDFKGAILDFSNYDNLN
jgi:hypothetical protein